MFINILHVYMRFYIICAFMINTDQTRTSVMKRLRPIGNGVLVNTNKHSLICVLREISIPYIQHTQQNSFYFLPKYMVFNFNYKFVLLDRDAAVNKVFNRKTQLNKGDNTSINLV